MESTMQQALKPVDAKVSVVLSDGGMTACVQLTAPQNGGEGVGVRQIREALVAKEVRYGLDEDLVETLGREPVFGKEIPVARGTPPEKGRSARIEFLFDTDVDIRPKEMEDGSVNYHELGIIQHVEAGQQLCVKTPATKGTDGVNVRGEQVPAQPGRDMAFPRGKNTVVSEDGLYLLAAETGHVDYVGRKVNVFTIYTIADDVGPATGNIDFDGSVVVKGNVLTGFAVVASGDITVRGSCETANIRSGGNVIIGEGVNGGTLEAAGEVRSEYLQTCKVYAEGNVYSGSVISSDVHCGGALIVTGRKGTIVGGNVSANSAIETTFIGARNSIIPTYVEVGLAPGVQKRVRELPEEIRQAYDNISNLDKAITLLSQMARAGKLDEDKAQKLRAATDTRAVEYEKYLHLVEEKEALDEKAQKLGYGKIIARGRISPGVKVVIGPHQMPVTDDLISPMITRGSEGLVVGTAH